MLKRNNWELHYFKNLQFLPVTNFFCEKILDLFNECKNKKYKLNIKEYEEKKKTYIQERDGA